MELRGDRAVHRDRGVVLLLFLALSRGSASAHSRSPVI